MSMALSSQSEERVSSTLRILLVEDSESDAELLELNLQRGGYRTFMRRVETGAEMDEALKAQAWDVVISDYTLPRFSGTAALQVLKDSGQDLPFIVVSGNIGEELAVATMKAGAHDYIMKNNLMRLGPAIEREVKEANVRRERNRIERTLNEIVDAVSPVAGDAFFRALVQAIVRTLRVSYAFIGEIQRDRDTVRTIALCRDGRLIENIEYRLTGTPCEKLLSGDMCICHDGLQETFPRDHKIKHMGVQSYIGLPLIRSTGEVVGVMAVLDTKPLNDDRLFESVLRFTAARASAELGRILADARVRASERELSAILENMQDTFHRTDTEGRVIRVSPSIEQLLGYTPDEVLGMPMENLYCDPGDRKAFLAELERGGGRVSSYEDQLRRKDGTTVWVSTNAQYYRGEGREVLGVEGTSRNITARKQAEEALRQSEELFSKAFHASPAMLSISRVSDDLDRDEFLDVNQSFLETTGYMREEVIGKSALELGLLPDPRTREKFVRRLMTDGVVTEADLKITTRDGGRRYALGSMEFVPIRGERCVLIVSQDITERQRAEEELKHHREHLEELVEQRTSELTKVVVDLESEITERKRVESALMEATDRAEAASRAKSDFLANMSHELRTPLNAIIGFAELLITEPDGSLDEGQKEKLSYVLDSAWHLLSLINDILDLSKVEAGKMALELSDFDLAKVLRNSPAMFREKCMNHFIKMETEIEEGIECIRADQRKIKQVIFNLLSNAVKFTPEGGTVTLCARNITREQAEQHCEDLEIPDDEITGFVEISVVDTGIGIAREEQGRLFQPFQQIDSSFTRRYAGTGLGLKLSKEFVELHGGRIRVESESGEGSIFTFIIPSR